MKFVLRQQLFISREAKLKSNSPKIIFRGIDIYLKISDTIKEKHLVVNYQ